MDAGLVVGDRFEIDRLAAAGGMGAVYRARDRETGARAAVKIVHTREREHATRLLRESKALSQLDHPNVVRYLGHGLTPSGDPFLAMEWIDGETLSHRIARGALGVSETLALAKCVADALGHAHAKGIVHRDVKPSNLILRSADLTDVVLVDFGVARGNRDDGLTVAGQIVGTPAFMSPEQARGKPDIEPAADIFALGCVIYRCLTGRNAFEAENQLAILAKVVFDDPPPLAAVLTNLDEGVEALVRRFLCKTPADRPPNGAAAAEAIRGLLERTLADARLAPVEQRLTLTERRLVSLVLASTKIDPEMTIADKSGKHEDPLAPIRAIAGRYGARCEVLGNGTLVLAVVGDGSATDQAAHAARCALELKGVLAHTPICLATGRTVVNPHDTATATGIGHRVKEDAFDKAAGLVAQLEALDARDVIVVDDRTAELLDRSFILGPHKLGVELRGVRNDLGDRARLLGRLTSCVGRDRELATLEALRSECESESVARAVLVTAPPGMGKSRLLREFVARVGTRAEVFHVVADATASGSRFAVLSQVAHVACDATADDSPEAKADKLRARVGGCVKEADFELVYAFVAEAAGMTVEPPSARVLAARADPRLMTEHVRTAFIEWLRAECAHKPLVLALDDVQWADVPTLRLVQDGIAACADAMLLVVLGGRPEASETLPRALVDRAVPLPVGSLSKKAAERLVRETLDEVSDEAVGNIVARAGGQPLLLEELIRASAEGHDDGGATAAIAMVQSRLETLDAECRRALRAASIFGETFWRSGVEHLLSMSIGRELDVLESKETILRSATSRHLGEQEFAFRHALVKDAAYAMLTPEDLALGHRLAGDWLEARGGVDPWVLSEHFARSDQPARAVPPLIRSAAQSLESGDFAAALARTARARSIGVAEIDLGSVLLLEAEAYLWQGDSANAERTAETALGMLPAGSASSLDCARVASFAAGLLGHSDVITSLAHRVADVVPSATTERAWLLAANQLIYNLTMAAPDPVASILLARTGALATAEMLERDPVLSMHHCHARTATAFREGRFDALLSYARQGMDHAAHTGNQRFAILNRTNIAFALLQLGDYEASLAELEVAHVDAKRLGLAPALATIGQNIGYVLMCLGRLEEARTFELAVIETATEGAPRLRTVAEACLARIHVRLGDSAAAIASARAGVEDAPTDVAKIYALAALAEAELAAGNAEEAHVVASSALAVAERLGSVQVGDVLAGRIRVEALLALGRREEARDALAVPLRMLAARADLIEAPALRRCLLERVEDHRQLLELERTLAAS